VPIDHLPFERAPAPERFADPPPDFEDDFDELRALPPDDLFEDVLEPALFDLDERDERPLAPEALEAVLFDFDAEPLDLDEPAFVRLDVPDLLFRVEGDVSVLLDVLLPEERELLLFDEADLPFPLLDFRPPDDDLPVDFVPGERPVARFEVPDAWVPAMVDCTTFAAPSTAPIAAPAISVPAASAAFASNPLFFRPLVFFDVPDARFVDVPFFAFVVAIYLPLARF
jgi:hypothetical protein